MIAVDERWSTILPAPVVRPDVAALRAQALELRRGLAALARTLDRDAGGWKVAQAANIAGYIERTLEKVA